MVFWGLGFFTSAASFSVYLEFASYFPNRSGSEVVYLEQAYPRPRWFFPTAFAFQTVALSFSSANAIGESTSKCCTRLLVVLTVDTLAQCLLNISSE